MSPEPEPVVFYAEIPHFYAAVERRLDPSLRDRPVIVGGDPRKRGQVQSASPEASQRGVRVGMSMLEALERCPRARAIKTEMKRYREVSSWLRSSLRSELASLEPAGLNAAYLERPSAAAESPEITAERLCARVGEDLGLPLRVGIAATKLVAKLAAEQVEAGQGGVRRVRSGEELDFLDPLPVEDLPGVGPKTASKLASLGARRVGDLARVGPERLERELGTHGLRILELARGEDASRIRAARHPQSLSHEHSFREGDGQLDLAVLGERLQRLAQALEASLRREGLAARRVALRLRYDDLETTTRSCTLPGPVMTAGEIQAAASSLLERTQAGLRVVRGLGLTLSGLAPGGVEDRQLDLFTPSS